LNDQKQVVARLHELIAQHASALGEGPEAAPGYTQDEQITRKSYNLVVRDALSSGVLTEADLQDEGLPKSATDMPTDEGVRWV
jgi:hypothetical protein